MTAVTTVRSLLDDLQMTPVEGVEGRYRIDFDASWKVLYIFGGVTFATLVEAAIAHIGRADLSPVSAQATYIEPVLEGPAAVQIDVLRSGRRGAQVRASLWNAEDPATPGAEAVVMDLVLGVHDPAAVDVIDRAMPADAGRPENAASREEMYEQYVEVPFHRQAEFRVVTDLESTHANEGRTITWFRMSEPTIDDSGAWRPSTLGVPGDILGPAVSRASGGGRYFVVTLQLSLQWFAPAITEWICQHTVVVRAANGFTTGTAELWSQDGELVGFATQTALMRPFARVQADGFGAEETQG